MSNIGKGNEGLSASTLKSISMHVSTPTYDRQRLKPKIVHLGVGHFVRAHLSMYLDRLLEKDPECDWGIWGVGLNSLPSQVLEVLARQDCLYTLTEKYADGSSQSRVIGSIIGIDKAEGDGEPLISRIADGQTKIVSLTITEGGYGIDAVTGKFSGKEDVLISADMADATSAKSWLGTLLHAIRIRKDEGRGPLTLMSCDNIPHNGKIAKEALVGFTEIVAPELVAWIHENMSFPNSMVDRVTPGTKDEDRDFIENSFGYKDGWPVICEPYALWVLEDDFVNGRPVFEEVDVKLVENVLPYELMKLRLANGAHQALCYFGYLLGYTYVHEAIHDEDIHALLIRYIDKEAVPTLEKIPDLDLNEWGRIVLDRFGNPEIKDLLSRICADTSDRIPKFMLPVVREGILAGRATPMCAAVIASWARYAYGIDEQGKVIDVVDPKKISIMEAAKIDNLEQGAFLDQKEIFGDIGEDVEFRKAYIEARQKLNSEGARALLRELAPSKD